MLQRSESHLCYFIIQSRGQEIFGRMQVVNLEVFGNTRNPFRWVQE